MIAQTRARWRHFSGVGRKGILEEAVSCHAKERSHCFRERVNLSGLWYFELHGAQNMLSPEKSIVVVGSINTDLVVTADRLPLPGETTTGRSFARFQGGKGANQAVAAAMLGADVTMIGRVGVDAFGSQSIRELESRGVHCEHIDTVPVDSGVALITVTSGGHNTIVVVPGANALVSCQYLESKRPILREASLVLTQLEIPLETVTRLAQICQEESVPLMLDPAPAAALPPGLLNMCAWFTPNETEASFYLEGNSGMSNVEKTATALHESGARNLILKMGQRGVYILSEGVTALQIPAIQVEAVDSTAAGDTFNGAFAAALVQGRSIEFCARFAVTAAGISVTRSGAQVSMPTLSEVKHAMTGADAPL